MAGLKRFYYKYGLLIIFLVILLLLWEAQMFADDLVFDRQRIVLGEGWRLWTGQWVHSNTAHQTMNIIGFILFLLLYKEVLAVSTLLSHIVYLSSWVGLGLWFFSPEISRYAGLSGVIYGLFTLMSLCVFFRYRRRDYLLGLGVFLGLTTKILWENIDPSINDSSAIMINATVATDAHLYAYLGAILLFSLYYFFSDTK